MIESLLPYPFKHVFPHLTLICMCFTGFWHSVKAANEFLKQVIFLRIYAMVFNSFNCAGQFPSSLIGFGIQFIPSFFHATCSVFDSAGSQLSGDSLNSTSCYTIFQSLLFNSHIRRPKDRVPADYPMNGGCKASAALSFPFYSNALLLVRSGCGRNAWCFWANCVGFGCHNIY